MTTKEKVSFIETKHTCLKCGNQVTVKNFPIPPETNMSDFKCPECKEVLITGEDYRGLCNVLFNKD